MPEPSPLTSDQLPERLSVKDVQALYGINRLATVRAEMHRAGAFMIGGKLYLRREDLLAFEESRRTAALCGPSLAQGADGSTPASRGHTSPDAAARGAPRRTQAPPTLPALEGDWWAPAAPDYDNGSH